MHEVRVKTHRGTIEALLGYHLYAMTEYKTLKELEAAGFSPGVAGLWPRHKLR